MIYLDTSVLLAQFFSEDRIPPSDLWTQTLISSRLLEYEAWTRFHGRGLAASRGEPLRWFLHRINFVELSTEVLSRALEPFPTGMRTLDALHLATVDFLQQQGQKIQFASYDQRQLTAADRMGIAILPLP